MVTMGLMVTFFIVSLVVVSFSIGFYKAYTHPSQKGKGKGAQQVAHVKLEGVIVSTRDWSDSRCVSANEILKILEDISKDENIKGILLEIDSPGGTPVASQDIAKAIHSSPLLRQIPTVAWIREVGASGAYWVASACDYIVASPLSITGSIGVLANNFGFEDTLQALHIRYRRQVAGNMKDIGDPFRTQTENEIQYMQHVLDQIHQKFIQEVGVHRKFEGDWAKDLANGIFFTGEDALKHKLIDKLGSKEEALDWMRRTLKAPTIELVDFKKSSPLLDWLHSEVRTLAQEFVNAIKISMLQNQTTIRT